MFSPEVCTFRAPPQERTFSGLVHFKHTRSRYLTTLLVAYWVQRCVLSGRHPTSAHFGHRAFQAHPYQIPGIQKPLWWYVWCRGMQVRGATARLHFFGIVLFKHTRSRYPKTLLVAYLVQRYRCLGRHTQECTFSGVAHFKHTCARYPKTLSVVCSVQRYARSGRHPKNAHFPALCFSHTPVLGIRKLF